MTIRELHRNLRRCGCTMERQGAKHPIWRSPSGKEFITPMSGRLTAGFLKMLAKQAGLSVKALKSGGRAA